MQKRLRDMKVGAYHANVSQPAIEAMAISPCCQQEWKLLNVLHSNKALSFINKTFEVNSCDLFDPQKNPCDGGAGIK